MDRLPTKTFESVIRAPISLICTAFLLVICVTGLPLVFRDEIGAWLDNGSGYASVPDNTPAVSLDSVAGAARGMYPGQIIGNIFIDDDEPRIMVAMAPSWAAYASEHPVGAVMDRADHSARCRCGLRISARRYGFAYDHQTYLIVSI